MEQHNVVPFLLIRLSEFSTCVRSAGFHTSW